MAGSQTAWASLFDPYEKKTATGRRRGGFHIEKKGVQKGAF